MDFSLSVQQKFIEKNMLNFVVEILEEDVEYEQIQYVKNTEAPECKKICIVGGQKSYNEISNSIDVNEKTYLRVWLYQSEP